MTSSRAVGQTDGDPGRDVSTRSRGSRRRVDALRTNGPLSAAGDIAEKLMMFGRFVSGGEQAVLDGLLAQ